MDEKQSTVLQELIDRVDSMVVEKKNLDIPEQGVIQIAFYKAQKKYEGLCKWISEKSGLSLKELAEKVGVSVTTMNDREKRFQDIPADSMKKLIKIGNEYGLDMEPFEPLALEN